MKEKRIQKITEIMTPMLQPGEYLMAASFANIGHVAVGKQLAMATATAVLSGGLVSVYRKPRPTYVVVTNYRVTFLEPSDFAGDPTSKINLVVPIQSIAGMTAPERGFTTVFRLLIHGQDKALRVMFPRPCRPDGELVINALRVPVFAG